MTTQRTNTPAATRPNGALVRDMTGRAQLRQDAPEVVLAARPAFDFVLSLVHEDAEILPADLAWRSGAMSTLTAALRHDLVRSFRDDGDKQGIGWALFPLIVPDASITTSADVVAAAGRLTAGELWHETLAGEPHTPRLRDLVDRHFRGEPDLEQQILAEAPAELRAVLERSLRDPAGDVRALRRILRAWQERFAVIEARITGMLQRDVELRREQLANQPLDAFIEQATNGYRIVLQPEMRTLRLSPSYFARPYNYVFGRRDWQLVCYPLADSALDRDAAVVPPAMLRLFRALGDESRLRILRLLAAGDLYLTEIADRMSLSKPTVSHHLAQLRAAGLVTVTSTGGLTYYSLRRDRLVDGGAELAAYLGVRPSRP